MKLQNLSAVSAFLILFWGCFVSYLGAEEKIIQEEKMAFDKCLNVISVSATKLSIAPQIVDQSNQRRVAVFTLSDGKLTITCDGTKGIVTVSTQQK